MAYRFGPQIAFIRPMRKWACAWPITWPHHHSLAFSSSSSSSSSSLSPFSFISFHSFVVFESSYLWILLGLLSWVWIVRTEGRSARRFHGVFSVSWPVAEVPLPLPLHPGMLAEIGLPASRRFPSIHRWHLFPGIAVRFIQGAAGRWEPGRCESSTVAIGDKRSNPPPVSSPPYWAVMERSFAPARGANRWQ